VESISRRSALQAALSAAAGEGAGRVFVLVHGSWHGGWCWRDVERRLRALGHVVFAPTLTGLAERAHLLSRDVKLSTHVDDVARLIEVEELERVCLVGHSYGGLVITHAAMKVVPRLFELVYLDAFVPSSGQTGFELMQAKYSASWKKRAEAEGEGFRIPPMMDAKSMGITDAKKAAWVDKKLTAHPIGTYEERLTFDEAAWGRLSRRYLRCKAFGGFGPTAERARKLGFPVQELDCGHDAMVADPEGLTKALLGQK
jgi:pimeloyl-ACP methyl ester carboxylesterase